MTDRLEDLEEYVEEPADAIATGHSLTKGKPWPQSVRFAVNPRLSDAEERFMKAITESGTTGTATAISIIRDLRAAGLGVGFIIPERP